MPIPALNAAKLKKVLEALEANWQAEMQGYHTYQTLADRDTDPVRAQVLRHLAQAELEHAALWESRIEELGGPKPVYSGGPGGEADKLANRAGGIKMALRRLEIEESRDIARYGSQLKELGDEGSVAILEHVIEDEKEHHSELNSLLRGHYLAPAGAPRVDPKAVLDELLAKRDQGRKQPGAWIGDAIYGVNDGLGAIFGIVAGVAGYTGGGSHLVVVSGLAGMLASALSMGSGAYLASKAEGEVHEAEVAKEKRELEESPAEEAEELALFYQLKGLSEAEARDVVARLARRPESMLRSLAQEELGINVDEKPAALQSAASSSIATAIGAIIPVIPFFFLQGTAAILAAAAISLVAHFVVGALKTIITARSWVESGLEMTIVGAIEGVITYGLGVLLSGHA